MTQKQSNSKHQEKVQSTFNQIVKSYDLMNDVISFGLHRRIKRKAIKSCVGKSFLDLAAGTGDLAIYIREHFGSDNNIILADPNAEMLAFAKKRLAENDISKNIDFVHTFAEKMPFENNSFDNVTIGFGFRNFTNREKALNEIYRVLKDNGKLIIIDFSKPVNPIIRIFNSIYSIKIVPIVAKLITGDNSSYHYLAKSIREHPNQNKIIKMMESAGLVNCDYYNKLNGIVAVHFGER